jgi:hypothetical protein
MPRISLNDWETLHTRKEIEAIHKSVIKKDILDYALSIEIILLLLGFFLDNAILNEGDKRTISWHFVGIAAIGLVGIPVWTACKNYKIKKEQKLRRVVKNSRDIVTLIDDKVCFYLMTAQSMYDNGIGIKSDIERFYLIETSYYLNKCVSILMSISNNISSALVRGSSADDFLSGKISKERIDNIFSILEGLYESITTTINQGDSTEKAKIKNTISANEYFKGELARIKKICN